MADNGEEDILTFQLGSPHQLCKCAATFLKLLFMLTETIADMTVVVVDAIIEWKLFWCSS